MSDPSRLEQTRPSGHGRARGLVSSRSSGQRVDALSFAVPEDLGDVVAAFWSGAWSLPEGAPHTTELLGDPSVHIVFEDSEDQVGGRVVGVWTTRWIRTLRRTGIVRGVKLRAGAARAFFGCSAHVLTDQISAFGEYFDDSGIVEMALGDDLEATFSAVADWLRTQRQRDVAADVSLAVAVMERVESDLTLTSVADLCEVAGLSERPLQRLFRGHVGASPKWALMRRRIQEAVLRLERRDHDSVADLAAALHYADQAHFARDFKRLVGQTPGEFRERVWR